MGGELVVAARLRKVLFCGAGDGDFVSPIDVEVVARSTAGVEDVAAVADFSLRFYIVVNFRSFYSFSLFLLVSNLCRVFYQFYNRGGAKTKNVVMV